LLHKKRLKIVEKMFFVNINLVDTDYRWLQMKIMLEKYVVRNLYLYSSVIRIYSILQNKKSTRVCGNGGSKCSEDQRFEFGPGTDDLFALEMVGVAPKFFIRRVEYVSVCHNTLHGDQDFGPVVNKVRDAECFADPGFLWAAQAEPVRLWIHAGLFPEVVVCEPGKTLFLHTESTLWNEEHVLGFELSNKFADRFECSWKRSRS